MVFGAIFNKTQVKEWGETKWGIYNVWYTVSALFNERMLPAPGISSQVFFYHAPYVLMSFDLYFKPKNSEYFIWIVLWQCKPSGNILWTLLLQHISNMVTKTTEHYGIKNLRAVAMLWQYYFKIVTVWLFTIHEATISLPTGRSINVKNIKIILPRDRIYC